MNEKDDYLFELGCEELPPNSLLELAESLKKLLIAKLDKNFLSYNGMRHFATARRLAVIVSDLHYQQKTQKVQKKGPAISAAYQADGSPTKAALGFARSCHTSLDKLDTLTTDKGSWLYFESVQSGEKTANLLPKIIQECLQALPIAKKMRWSNQTESFVRPIHWVLSIHGHTQLPLSLWNINSSNISFGHRVHAPNPLTISAPSEYENTLEQHANVIPCFEKRKSSIRKQLLLAAKDISAKVIIPEYLLTEVTAIVEWPLVLIGQFDSTFLNIPKEVLTCTMQSHQKYFSLVDKENSLLPKFALVTNLESLDARQIIEGNQRVIAPRFSDAQFFYHQDQKQPLQAFNESLKKVLFEKSLGSVFSKVQRIIKIATYISAQIGADTTIVSRAALLCKADLACLMVQEFPELQGTMGRYYAIACGEDQMVAQSIAEHYLPQNMNDSLPSSPESACVALADKLDSLVGIFATGKIPSGDKDPFALRRAAFGIIKILIDIPKDINLNDLLNYTKNLFEFTISQSTANQLTGFLEARLPAIYPNFSAELLESVMSLKSPLKPYSLHLQLQAVKQFTLSENFQPLVSVNKRIHNLLKKVDPAKSFSIDNNKFEAPEEITLYNKTIALQPIIKQLTTQNDYLTALHKLCILKDTIDPFFENVLIMTENVNLRQQRLALLKIIQTLFLSVADLSKLPSE